MTSFREIENRKVGFETMKKTIRFIASTYKDCERRGRIVSIMDFVLNRPDGTETQKQLARRLKISESTVSELANLFRRQIEEITQETALWSKTQLPDSDFGPE